MIKPPETPASPILTLDEFTWEQSPTLASSPPFDVGVIGQTVLKLPHPVELVPFSNLDFSSTTLTAMQHLVEVLAYLRSPEGGCPPDLPLTPEHLIPYATEEAYEVLEALQNEAGRDQSATSLSISDSQLPNSYVLLNELIPHLLFYIARSSYVAMQLIEGIAVRVCPPGNDWQSGMMRLVANLQVETSNSQWSLDLATNQPPQALLIPGTLIQSNQRDFSCQGDRVEQLSQTITQHIQEVTPVAKRFIEGSEVLLLEPGKSWQTGRIQLQIGFEFIAEAPTTAAVPSKSVLPNATPSKSVSSSYSSPPDETDSTNFTLADFLSETVEPTPAPAKEPSRYTEEPAIYFETIDPDFVADADLATVTLLDLSSALDAAEPFTIDVAVVQEPRSPIAAPDAADPLPLEEMGIRFRDHNRLANHVQTALQQGLAKLASQLRTVDPSAELDAIFLIGREAFDLVDRLFILNQLDQLSTLQADLNLGDLIPRMLWQVTSTAFEIMPLVGGVSVNTLQPGAAWMSGSLRLVTLLTLSTAEQEWTIDLATAQPLQPNTVILPLDAIVQFASEPAIATSSLHGQHPIAIADLITQLTQQIRITSSDLEALIDGIGVDLQFTTSTWQAGTISLSISFSFTPDISPIQHDWAV